MVMIVLVCFPADIIKAASGLKLYNYTTKETFTYSGVQVKVTLNDKQISKSNTPGIIINGIAMVPYKDIFVKSGIKLDYVYDKPNNALTLKKGNITIAMKLGSKKATVNGKAVTLPVAPIKMLYKNTGITCILVPSRFVAETFGLDYTWNKNISTVAIVKKNTVPLSYNNGKPFDYSGTLGKVIIDGQVISLGNMPSIITNNTAMLRAKRVFADSDIGAEYKYDKTTQLITLSTNGNTLTMKIGSLAAQLNGNPISLSTAPMIVTNHEYNSSYIMVPGSITASYLGYDYKWDNKSMTSIITSRDNSKDQGSNPGNIDGSNNSNPDQNDDSAPELGDNSVIIDSGNVLYEWNANTSLISECSNIVSLNQAATSVINNGYIYNVSRDYTKEMLNAETYMVMSTEPFNQVNSSVNGNILDIFAGSTQSSDSLYQIAGISGNIVNTIKTSYRINELRSNVAFDMTTKDFKYDLSLSDDRRILFVTVYVNSLKRAVVGTNASGDYISLTGITPLKAELKKENGIVYVDIPGTVNCLGELNTVLNGTKNLGLFYAASLSGKTQIIIGVNDNPEYYISENDNIYTIFFSNSKDNSGGTGNTGDSGNTGNTGDSGNTGNTGNNGNGQYIDSPIVIDKEKYEIVIPKPEGVIAEHITHTDYYYENKFSIKLKGDHTNFFKNKNVTYNSSVISNVLVFLNNNGETEIKFTTKKLQGYKFVWDNDNIYVHIGNPRDIYKNIVVLDPGHGGPANGAKYFGTNEKDLNFKMLYTIGEKYFNSDPSKLKVYYTRQTDVDITLADRAAFASKVGADIFVSLHMNASTAASANGTEVYYSESNNKANKAGLTSKAMATVFVNNLVDVMGTKNRGVVAARYTVVHNNTVPAVLIELGFLSNKNDYAKISDSQYQEKAVQTIYKSILQIFEKYPTGR